MTSNLTVLKLGGSVITDKSSAGTINYKAIRELASVIASNPRPLIIIHGAGSLGHPEAKKWHLADGVSQDNAEGINETHEAVSSLNREVVKALREAGINAVSFPPFASALAKNKRLHYAGEKQIAELLAVGITPVLFGDVVIDTKLGACIVSGDQLAPYLARALSAERVGIVTSVGGVLDNGKVIPLLSRVTAGKISFVSSDCADVTGGMKGKVDELLALAEEGIDSQIFAPHELADFLNGKNPGTRVTNGS